MAIGWLTALLVVGALEPAVNAEAGRALFTGRTRLANGGPACVQCHAAANIGLPYGGSMGPDLTSENSKLSPTGLRYALQTLFFPAMNALFLHRPLTASEQEALASFFREIDGRPAPPDAAPALLFAGLAGFAALIIFTALAGRGRVRSMRRALLERAARSER